MDIKDIEARIEALDNEIGTLMKELDDQAEQIDSLKERVRELEIGEGMSVEEY